MYRVYMIYGMSAIGNYSTVISSMGYLVEKMPGHNPSFWVGLGMQFFAAFLFIFVIVYGHKLRFEVKLNFAILLQIPLVLMIPLSCKFSDSSDVRFYVYVCSQVTVGGINCL